MNILALIAAASISIPQLIANITSLSSRTTSDPELINEYCQASAWGLQNANEQRELILKVPVSDEEMESLESTFLPDGSWSDVDYETMLPGSWPAQLHTFRVQRLAIRYVSTGDVRAREMALAAMDCWAGKGLVNRNWWHNQVGVPRVMGPAYIMLLDCMSEKQRADAVKVMSTAYLGATGANKVWLCGNVLLKAVLEGDEDLVIRARDEIASEVRMTDSDEGLQRDLSFHQHGPMLQFGTYGLAYACSLSWWGKVFEGTGLDFSQEQEDLLKSYIKDGLGRQMWNGYYDVSACGRQMFMNIQKGKALCVDVAADFLGMELEPAEGGIYYQKSDFGSFNGDGWHASIRMQSERISGFETTNNENMRGYFSSDGALLIYRDGDEYNDIFPCWNWRRIPGTTTYDDGKELYGTMGAHFPYNKTGNVFGEARDGVMAAAMDLNRDGLNARKAWFFFDDCIVCLGSGISMDSESAEVVTTIEQNLLSGNVRQGDGWASHRGTTYIMLDGQPFELSAGARSGDWKAMSPEYSDENVSMDIFEMAISHGAHPSGASYAYAVSPMGRNPRRAARKVRRSIEVVSNSADLQSVRAGGKTITVDWSSCTVRF